MTDVVASKASEAKQALSEAETKILKITGDASVKAAEIKADATAASNDIKSSTAKAGEDAKKALKDQSNAIASKKAVELKKVKDAEDTSKAISLKAASDAANVYTAGVNGLDAAAAAVVAKAGADVKEAQEKAVADVVKEKKVHIDALAADKGKAETEATSIMEKMITLRAMMVA